MTRPVLFSLAAVFATAAILGGFYLAQPSPMALRVKQLEGELSQVREENLQLKAEFEKVQTAVKKSDSETAQHSVRNVTQTPVQAGTAGANSAASSSALQFGNGKVSANDTNNTPDPARVAADARVKDMVNRIQDNQIDLNYGRLFKQFGFNDEELKQFKQLLSDRQTKQREIITKNGQPGQTADQKKLIPGELAAAKKEFDAAMQHFLNSEEDYQTFKEWESSMPDRMQLQQAVTSFDAADAALSPDQRERLLNLMIAESKASAQQTKAGKSATPAAPGLSNYNAQLVAKDQNVLQQAAAFLSPEQLHVLQKAQEQHRAIFNPPIPAPTTPTTPVGPAKVVRP